MQGFIYASARPPISINNVNAYIWDICIYIFYEMGVRAFKDHFLQRKIYRRVIYIILYRMIIIYKSLI